MLLKNCRILNGDFKLEKKDIYVNEGKIAFQGEAEEVVDLTGFTVTPGFIDLHIHGFKGVNVADSSVGELERMSDELLRCGVTSFLATTSTLEHETLIRALENVATVMASGKGGAEILGVNMEGPFISPKRTGAMRAEFVRPFDEVEFLQFKEASENSIRLMTLAPEIPENYRGIEVVLKNGAVPSIGHTDASSEDIARAVSAGMLHTTHLYNAMRGMTHREAGVVGGVLDSTVTAELICDGIHICPEVIRTTYKVLGRERLILISDAIPLAGFEDGEYDFDGQVSIIKDGSCKLPNGTINGNVNSLFECVKRCVTRFGIPFEDAVYCASLGPAKRLGLELRKGSIEEGKDADLAVIDGDFNLKYVIKSGRIVKIS